MRAAFLLGRNLTVCLSHLGGEVEAEQAQRALPSGEGGNTHGDVLPFKGDVPGQVAGGGEECGARMPLLV